MSTEATYMGQPANQGRIEPTEIFENEGFAVLKCGGTEVVLTYTALHRMTGHLAAGGAGDSNVKDRGAILKAIQAICCEAAAGNRG